jgi:hypothetical protein
MWTFFGVYFWVGSFDVMALLDLVANRPFAFLF